LEREHGHFLFLEAGHRRIFSKKEAQKVALEGLRIPVAARISGPLVWGVCAALKPKNSAAKLGKKLDYTNFFLKKCEIFAIFLEDGRCFRFEDLKI
jgi:hypothetical protein